MGRPLSLKRLNWDKERQNWNQKTAKLKSKTGKWGQKQILPFFGKRPTPTPLCTGSTKHHGSFFRIGFIRDVNYIHCLAYESYMGFLRCSSVSVPCKSKDALFVFNRAFLTFAGHTKYRTRNMRRIDNGPESGHCF